MTEEEFEMIKIQVKILDSLMEEYGHLTLSNVRTKLSQRLKYYIEHLKKD